MTWRRALDGMDSFVNMVMRNPGGANETEQTVEDIVNNYEVNTVGLHLLLWTAQTRWASGAASTSAPAACTTSAGGSDGRIVRYQAEETCAARCRRRSTASRRVSASAICQYFAEHFGMRIIALRITGPRTREAFLAERRVPIHPELYVMDEEDLADAVLSALDVVQVGEGRLRRGAPGRRRA